MSSWRPSARPKPRRFTLGCLIGNWKKYRGEVFERHFVLGELEEMILQVFPGQKIAYFTDAAYTQANAAAY